MKSKSGEAAVMKTVVCLGDSITYGRVGESYFEMLKRDFKGRARFINCGVNGDLSYDVLKRLNKVMSIKPDFIILLIGTNDVWATYSEKVMNAYMRRNKLPERPSKEGYERNLRRILQELGNSNGAKIGVMSLPLITEDPEHVLFKRSIDYSDSIKETALEMNVGYIVLNERQRDYLKMSAKATTTSQEISWELTLRVVLRHSVFRKKWDELSRENGLLLTVDHVHQNGTGATLIKDCAAEFLREFHDLD